MSEKKPLHEIVSDALEITNALIESGGEVTPEIDEKIKCNEVALTAKVDSYVIVDERLSNEEAYWSAKAKEFSAIAKGFGEARERLKTNIKSAMIAMNTDEIKGGDYRYKLSKAKPSLVLVDKEVPHEYMIVEIKPDKEKIRAALADGFSVAGAQLVESVALRAYKNKKQE